MSEKYIRRSRATASRRIGDETMVLAIADSTLFSLNEVAGLIWECADGQTPLSAIVTDSILPTFETDAATAYRDALELAEQLARAGLLEIADTPLETAAR